ncbi:MAG TPA: nucleotidyl transferase AbiEii/AbiGii toxin family protein [Alphaproteobacteria bacterium]|nr:nucleotidyl transferase AbiEii/AbiGii toxin family protein [Alphaproteobacteria bacterium]
MQEAYFRRVDLLLSILPDVMKDPRLALKGGTAINLFVFDMPRLSVDIDLTYVPIEDRFTTLEAIDTIFGQVKDALTSQGLIVTPKYTADNHAKQLVVIDQGELVKIEINHILRGCAYPPANITLCPKARDKFKKFMNIQCLDENDLFAGKICAALDRQHPRDLYDMRFFLEIMAYTRELHNAFLIYLISNNRPISELIRPNQQDISHLYTNEFKGMTELDISLEELYKTFSEVVGLISSSMTTEDKQFLLSFKAGTPKWELMPFEHVQNLPAIKWKLYNISKMEPEKRRKMLAQLEKKLA